MAGNFREIQSVKKRNFLNAFARTGRIDKSAELVGMDSSLHYHWKKDDPEYARAFVEAREMAAERLEDEAARRGYEGILKPVFQGGKEVGTIREYSDTLLIFLLKGAMPDKYKERIQINIDGYLRQVAEENGLDPDELIREAQTIVSGSRPT